MITVIRSMLHSTLYVDYSKCFALAHATVRSASHFSGSWARSHPISSQNRSKCFALAHATVRSASHFSGSWARSHPISSQNCISAPHFLSSVCRIALASILAEAIHHTLPGNASVSGSVKIIYAHFAFTQKGSGPERPDP